MIDSVRMAQENLADLRALVPSDEGKKAEAQSRQERGASAWGKGPSESEPVMRSDSGTTKAGRL